MVGKSVSEKLAEKKAAAAKSDSPAPAKDADGFETIRGAGGDRFMSFAAAEEGDTFIGTFIEHTTGQYGPQATFEDEEGNEKVITLTSGLKGPCSQLKPGDVVRITHLGLKPSKNFPGKNFRAFDVAVKRA